MGVLARCGRGTADLSTKLGSSLASSLAFGVSAGTNRSRRGETDRSALLLFGLGNEYAYYARVWRHRRPRGITYHVSRALHVFRGLGRSRPHRRDLPCVAAL